MDMDEVVQKIVDNVRKNTRCEFIGLNSIYTNNLVFDFYGQPYLGVDYYYIKGTAYVCDSITYTRILPNPTLPIEDYIEETSALILNELFTELYEHTNDERAKDRALAWEA